MAQATLGHRKALAGDVTPGDAPAYPITRSREGHSRRTDNLAAPTGTPAIIIPVDKVTVSLNGFTVMGPGLCLRDNVSKKISCIGRTNFQTTAVVMDKGSRLLNGVVRGFCTGIGLAYDNTDKLLGSAIRSTRAFMNGGAGLSMPRGNVSGSSFNANNSGTSCYGCLIVDSIAMANECVGFITGAVSRTLADMNGLKNDHVTSLGGTLNGVTPIRAPGAGRRPRRRWPGTRHPRVPGGCRQTDRPS